jgi:Zn-dependent peptidase ImmA (M78 family)
MSIPSSQSIQEAVAKMRALIGNAVPVPVDRLLNAQGYSFRSFYPRNASERRISGYVDHASKTVFVNRGERPERQLFTGAHELGHILLTPDQAAVEFRDERTSAEALEQAVDRFAAELLMPADIFCAVWAESRESVGFTAEYFGVSKAAVRKRAEGLGMSND